MTRIKYIARYQGEIVGRRISSRLDKTYTHAVMVTYTDGRHPKVVTWCSRLDLAMKEQRNWSHRYFAQIVPVEITNPEAVAASRAELEALRNAR